MVKLLAYPLRLDNKGSFVTLEDGPDYYPQELANLLMTEPGERPLVPDYGIADPTFDTFHEAELVEKVAMFGPPVEIGEVSVGFTNDGRLNVDILYDDSIEVEDELTGEDPDSDYLDDDEEYYDDDYEDDESLLFEVSDEM